MKRKLTRSIQPHLFAALATLCTVPSCSVDVLPGIDHELADDADRNAWQGLVHTEEIAFAPQTGDMTFKGYNDAKELVVDLRLEANSDSLVYHLSLLGQPFELSVRYSEPHTTFQLQRDDIARALVQLSEDDPSASSIRPVAVDVDAEFNYGLSHLDESTLEYLSMPIAEHLDEQSVASEIDQTLSSIATLYWDSAGTKLCTDVDHNLVDWLFVNKNICN